MEKMKLLLGGSPCTHWSIARTKNRETEPEGLGWELFKNYLIALEKFKPDFFLYENNKIMAPAIRAQITRELGVEPILINSTLVSAQNRQRLYWTNIPGVEQPEDRGMLLRDILESGLPLREKAYCLKAQYSHGVPDDDHVELLEAIKAHRGPAIISGYDSDLYNRELKGWYKDGRTSFTQTASRRREILWMNFEPAAQMDMFREE